MSETTLIAVVIGIVMLSLVLALLFRGTERKDAKRKKGGDGGAVYPVSDGRRHDSDGDGSSDGGGDGGGGGGD